MLKKKEETDSLAHTRWNCKYHIVFAPKYRRQIIYGQIKGDIGNILRKLCEYKGVEIIEAEACPDHIHKSEILVSYLNGENTAQQKQRAEAVDMMKHIAAAWDIDAEEVFGRADE